MSEAKAKFLKIFIIELEDLIEAVEALLASHHQRLAEGKITDYVFNENTAFLSAEKQAISNFLQKLQSFDYNIYSTVQELAQALTEDFENFLAEHDYAPALKSFVKKKIKKVLDYCSC